MIARMVRAAIRLPSPLVAAAAASVVTALVVVAIARSDSGVAKWIWRSGSPSATVGTVQSAHDLHLNAGQNVDIFGNHVRIGGKDGNFEFESYTDESHLNAYGVGSPVRHPISVGGGDDQDVVGFIVRGKSGGQSSDIQQWQVGDDVVAAIDGKGRLRLGSITLRAAVRNGKEVLLATFPDGKTQVVAAG